MDKTSIQETGAALFCAIADVLGSSNASKVLDLKIYPTYTEFKKKYSTQINQAFKAVNSPGVSLTMIENLFESNSKADREFYNSSVNIANTLIKEIGNIDKDFKISPPSIQNIFYYRADKSGTNVMKNITTLFSLANKQDKMFGDINKWSPADIYLASNEADKTILKEIKEAETKKSYTFNQLNDCINKLIDKGQLVGLSLKKSVTSASLHKINFDRAEDKREILDKLKFAGMKSDNPRDVIIYFNTSGSKPYLKARHDPSSDTLGASSAIKLEIEIVGARGGSLVGWGKGNKSGTGFTDVWARVDEPAAQKSAAIFSNGFKTYTTEIGKLNTKYSTDLKKVFKKTDGLTKGLLNSVSIKDILEKKSGKTTEEFTFVKKIFDKIITDNEGFDAAKKTFKTFAELRTSKATLYDFYKNERITLSQKYVVDGIKTHLIEYLTKNASKTAKDVIVAWYTYITGMSPKSGKFIIAKSNQ
jgi:hypothetical protein